MLELILVVPVLLVLFFAVAELSVALLRWQAVDAAAREGARAASLLGADCPREVETAVERAVREVVSAAGLSSPDIDLAGACSAGRSTVRVRVPYRFRILPDVFGRLSPVHLSATSAVPSRARPGSA